MILATLEALVGLGLLVIAGDALVRGAAALAENIGISPLVIGLTVVAFGTSAPELFVAVEAMNTNAPTLALGNVVGSNIANALIVVGIPALIAPLTCGAPRLNRNMAIMLGATVVFILFAMSGRLVLWHGLVLLAGLATFLLYSGRRASRNPAIAEEYLEFEQEIAVARKRPLLAGVLMIGGFLGLAIGANMLVEGSVLI
ncbi:MAG: sodium:calcium antiporter, partial [Rhodothalassiaceae bacterium]